MRIAITKCYSCICNVCTRFRCPYPHQRCRSCTSLDFKRIYDCDYFESIHTAPRRFRIRRKGSRSRDLLNVKLDMLLEHVGLIVPQIDTTGTYAVYFDGVELYRGSYVDVDTYIAKIKSGFSKPLRVEKIEIDL